MEGGKEGKGARANHFSRFAGMTKLINATNILHKLLAELGELASERAMKDYIIAAVRI